MKIRTRFAPSPTGFLHIGGLRSALYSFLFAKHFKNLGHDSEYIFRIEDTDIKRHIEEGISALVKGQEWVGIIPGFSNPEWWNAQVFQQKKPDGSFISYRQSEKFSQIAQIAEELVKRKLAYYDYHTSEELEKLREEKETKKQTPRFHLSEEEIKKHYEWAKKENRVNKIIRLKMPENRNFEWNDMIRGKMIVPSDSLTDPVLLKSDGIPMYNLAVVYDDYIMEITHITRAEEHLSNTPYQIAIREAIEPILLEQGFSKNNEPFYAHLPIVIGSDGKKLSKRNKTLLQFVCGEKGQDYISLGYFPDAIRNFVVLLGWTTKDNKEILSLEEMIERFDGTRIVKAPAFFDIKKMNWLSGEYFKNMSESSYLEFVKPFININLSFTKLPDLALLTFKKQISCAFELNNLVKETFIDLDFSQIDQILNQNSISKEDYEKCVSCFLTILKEYEQITIENTDEIINKVKTQSGFKGKTLFMPIRLYAIGKEHGPEMNKILPVIGKENLLNKSFKNQVKINE